MRSLKPDPDSLESALGTLLVEGGYLERAGFERARRACAAGSDPLCLILTRLGLVSESDMASALAELLGLPVATAGDYPSTAVLDGTLSANFLKEARAIPLADEPEALVLAVADPLDGFVPEAVALKVGKPVLTRIARPGDIETAFERLYGRDRGQVGAVVDGIDAIDQAGTEADIEKLKDQASEAPVIRLVNAMIAEAVEARASDIHIEPFENRLRVRYRVDGVLTEATAPPPGLQAAIVSRIKILAKLNIAERRLPQDGRIKLTVRGKEVDFRVSTLPTVHGESVDLRILDRDSVVLDFAELGFDAFTTEQILEVLKQPNGIFLVTGPTGSGKSTTLYTSLITLNTPDRNIITVEDPVEYQLEGVNQLQVKPQIDLTFAALLRSILRHDPDIIMVGEIRYLETAQIAVQASLTGHLVLSTLHTNSAAASVTRLLDMGVADYLLTSTPKGILAQRLVRTLCRACREPYEALPELVAQIGLPRENGGDPLVLHRPVGCAHCGGSGYLGRTSIGEILVMSDSLRRLTLRQSEAHEIERAAIGNGMRTLYEDGLRKAVAGETSIEEILRVTRESREAQHGDHG